MAMHDNGLTKIIEECSELLTVIAKLKAYPHGDHPDGRGNLLTRLEEELADAIASMHFFVYFKLPNDVGNRIHQRMLDKVKQYCEWDKEG